MYKYLYTCMEGAKEDWNMQVVGISGGRIIGDLYLLLYTFSPLFSAMNISVHFSRSVVSDSLQPH